MNLRKILYRAKYVLARELDHKIPVDVSLELSSSCSMSCRYCYMSDKKNLPFEQGTMSWTTAQLIIAEAAELGVNSLKFNWKGEGTLNPYFRDIAKMAKDHASKSTFIDRISNSNFKFYPSKREDIFMGLVNMTKVKVSYDSFDKKVFETQRAGGDHDLTTENINLFYNHPLRKDTEIVIQAVRTKLNKDEDIAGEVKRRWPEATCNINDMVEGRINSDLSNLVEKKRDFNNRQPCVQAFSRLIFNWKGEAFPCCVDISESIKLGDIKTDGMRSIFNSKKAFDLRKSLKNKTAFARGACKSCSSHESYLGWKPKWRS